MNLRDLVSPKLIFPDLEGADGPAVLRSIAEGVVAAGYARDADALYDKLIEREKLGSTAMGGGVAIPHCKLAGLDDVVLAIGIARQGVELEAPDEQPVSLLFLVLSPPRAPAAHLRCLATISRWIKDGDNVATIRALRSSQEIYDFLARPYAS